MVSLEFEKPSTWSIGKKIAPIAIILLIVGPFFPFFVMQFRGVGVPDITEEPTYFDFDSFGLWMFIPLLSAIFIILLLYLKFDIYLEKDDTRLNAKPFIIMLWGFLFFLMYLSDAVLIGRQVDYGGLSISYFPGSGLLMIVVGFFLCAVVGFLEWRYPSVSGPKVSLTKKEEPEVMGEQAPEAVATAKPENAQTDPMVRVEEPMVEPKVEPEPLPTTVAILKKEEEAVKEPTSEEEKALQRWARHINRDGQTFEKCIKCNNYTFIDAKDMGKSILFKCPDCGASFTLTK